MDASVDSRSAPTSGVTFAICIESVTTLLFGLPPFESQPLTMMAAAPKRAIETNRIEMYCIDANRSLFEE